VPRVSAVLRMEKNFGSGLVTSLAQTDAVAKLLIEKGVITQDEFMKKLKAERATHQAMLEKVGY